MGRFIRRKVKDIRTIPPEILSLRPLGNPRRERGLTEKQERFARYVAGGNMTYAEAAVKAGLQADYASALMNEKKFPRVVERVREIKQELAYRTDLTFESHVAKMAEIRDAAMDKGNFTAAVAAEKSRGQAAGFYVSRSEIMVGKIDQMSREEVMAEIKRLQAEFPSLVTGGEVIDAEPLAIEQGSKPDAENQLIDDGGEDVVLVEIGNQESERDMDEA